MAGKQDVKTQGDAAPASEQAATGALASWLDGGDEPDDLVAAYASADDETRDRLFSTLVSMRDQIGSLADAIEVLDLRGQENAGACEVAEIRLGELVAERDQLRRQLSAQKGAATKARREVAALEAKLPPEPRDFRGVKPATATAIFADLDDADDIELVFLDAEGVELAGIAPRKIDSEGWALLRGRLRLKVPSLKLHGPAPGAAAVRLAGYGLIVDGTPIATTRRSDVLTIGGGTTMELKDDVVF